MFEKVKGIEFLNSDKSTPIVKAEIVLNIYELADWLLKNHEDNDCRIVIVEDKKGNLIPLIRTEELDRRIIRSKRKNEIT